MLTTPCQSQILHATSHARNQYAFKFSWEYQSARTQLVCYLYRSDEIRRPSRGQSEERAGRARPPAQITDISQNLFLPNFNLPEDLRSQKHAEHTPYNPHQEACTVHRASPKRSPECCFFVQMFNVLRGSIFAQLGFVSECYFGIILGPFGAQVGSSSVQNMNCH